MNLFSLQNKLTNWDGIRDQVKIYCIIYLWNTLSLLCKYNNDHIEETLAL